MEKLFSASLHGASWCWPRGLFSGGIAVQVIARFSNLMDLQWNRQSRAILDSVV